MKRPDKTCEYKEEVDKNKINEDDNATNYG
jgi:hypothetical protein